MLKYLQSMSLVIGSGWLLLNWAPQTIAAAADKPIVVMISMDGLRHDYPDLPNLPGMRRMQEQGLRVNRMTPVYPSNTFPGHVSLATGAHPQVHGIVDNYFSDRERGVYFMSADTQWLDAEPLWITAERQGVPSATYFWVGSEQDWRGQGTRYRIAPFDGNRPEREKVDQLLAWLALPESERPRLIMNYWAGTDRVAHRYGPDSANTHKQLQRQDAQLVRLLQGIDQLGLWNRLTLVLVSDHGMTNMGDYVNLQQRLARVNITARVTGYTVAHVFLDDLSQLEVAAAELATVAGVNVLLPADARARYQFMHPTRSGDLVVLAHPPLIFSRPGGSEGALMALLRFFGWDFGGHGYAPDLPDMGASWLMLGRGITPGTRLPQAHQVDVAPTVAGLLGIDPPKTASGVDVLDRQ